MATNTINETKLMFKRVAATSFAPNAKKGLYNFIRALIHFRKSHPTIDTRNMSVVRENWRFIYEEFASANHVSADNFYLAMAVVVHLAKLPPIEAINDFLAAPSGRSC